MPPGTGCRSCPAWNAILTRPDRKSTRLNPSHVEDLVCRLLLEKKNRIFPALSRVLPQGAQRARGLSRLAGPIRPLDWLLCFRRGRSTPRETSFSAKDAALRWFAREK